MTQTKRNKADWILTIVFLIILTTTSLITAYLMPENPEPVDTTLTYLLGIVLGALLMLIFSFITRNEKYPIPKTSRRTDSVILWFCIAGVVISGIILAFAFSNGLTYSYLGIFRQTRMTFLLGVLIGITPVALTIGFTRVRYDIYRLTHSLKGRKKE